MDELDNLTDEQIVQGMRTIRLKIAYSEMELEMATRTKQPNAIDHHIKMLKGYRVALDHWTQRKFSTHFGPSAIQHYFKLSQI